LVGNRSVEEANPMRKRHDIWLMAGVALLLLLVPVLVLASSPAQEGQNLLTNPGFEGGWHWQGDSFLGKIADGWTAWWVDDASGKSDSDPSFWQNQRPEYGLIGLEFYIPDQIHSGRQALQYGKRYATHTAGVYQQVAGLTPGTKVHFSAWGFVFGKDPDPSRTPGYARMKVGIDPNGGTNPFGPNVAWSGIVNPVAVGSGSAWQQMSVETVAANSTVTVFVYSSPEWPMNDGLTSQWDDASLVVTGQAEPPTGTAPPPPPTNPPGTPLPPAATATPRPDGSIVHQVQPGDTVWGIAIQYAAGSTITPEEMLAQINRLNNNPSLIYSGQELVIAVPGDSVAAAVVASQSQSGSTEEAEASAEEAEATTAEAEAQAPEVESAGSAQPAAPAVAQSSGSSSTLCVSAYHDRNADGMRDPTTEELVPDAGFTLSNDKGVVGSYTSDGVSEPYCFAQLVPGTYMVQLTKPGGYNTTTPEYWAVPLPAGATANVEFGHQGDPNAPAAVAQAGAASSDSSSPDDLLQAAQNKSGDAQEADSGSKSLLSSLGEIAIGVSGIFVLLLAGAVGVAFVASRRRA
jgi:LysM repeat protein